MGSIRTILAAVSGITCIAVVIAFSEKSNSCSNYAAFVVRQSVSPGGKVSQLPVGCRLRHRHRPLRRLQPLAYWIEETVSLEVPAPHEAAYNVYTDLVRQPEWSPWLKSIEHDREKQSSKWVVQQRGIRISWSAVSTLEIPGVEVQWKSTTGLNNRGRVRFEETGPARCLMTLTLSYNLPYVIAKLLRLEVVEKIVQRTLLSDLERFVDVLSKQPEVIAATTAAQEVTSDKLSSPNSFPQAASEGRTIDGMDELRIAPTEAEPGSQMPPNASQKAAALGAATAVSTIGTHETIEAPENDSESRKDNRYDDHAEMLGATPGLKDSGDLVELNKFSRDRQKGGRRKLWRQRIRRLFRRDRLDGEGEAHPGRSGSSLGEDR